ncbi:MAG: hypothetical protein GY865_09780 [candidate division Zixibacteria bacterium]|nr:hypothetical protein [candidate division Zixibacteria bacterium]
MKKLPKMLIVTLVIAVLIPSFVYSQQQQQQTRNRFDQEFGITNEVINQARNIISSSGIDKGSELLKLAEKIQTQSRNMGMGGNFTSGIILTKSARDKAKNAALLNRQSNENENLVRRQIEKTDKLLDRVRANMPNDVGNKIESLYNTAQENQRRAREFYHNQQLRPALKLSRQVENRLKRLIERVKETNGDQDRLRNQIERLENKIIRVENLMENCGNNQAEQILNEVRNRFAKIKSNQDNIGFKAIENRLRGMNQRLNSAIEMCQDNDIQTEKLNRLKADFDRVAGLIRESGDKRAQKLLKTANKNLNKAERFCLSGDSEACAANIKAAQISLRKAKKMAGL